MSWRLSAGLAILCLAPGIAAADGPYLPGLGLGGGLPGFGLSGDLGPRPSYREAYDHFPPLQHNILGMPVPPPSPYGRASYRESYDEFPPPRGRYGGGIVEYVITGGRSGLLPSPALGPASITPPYPPAVPAYAAEAPEAAARLPRARLPDYMPEQPPASYGDASQ